MQASAQRCPIIVQQATNHGWVNPAAQPCRILFVLMDAKPYAFGRNDLAITQPA